MINFEEIWNLTLQKLTKIYVGVFSLSFYVLCKRVVVRRTQLLLGKKSCVPLEPWTHASTKQIEKHKIGTTYNFYFYTVYDYSIITFTYFVRILSFKSPG